MSLSGKKVVITGTESDEPYLTDIRKTYLNHQQVIWLQSKLNMWLTKRGEAGGFLRTSLTTPFGTSRTSTNAIDQTKRWARASADEAGASSGQ